MPYVTEQNLTDVVLDRWKNIPDPRLRQVMGSLNKHLHGFVRDIEPTEKEWAAAIDFLTRTGKMCDDKRQEFILFSDGMGVGGATLDLWQTDGEGLYEAQRDVTEPWMRGLYKTRPDGSYAIRTVAPIGYTIPMDGPVGELVKKTSISPMRPAHIHFCVESPGYHRVVTHLFQRGCPYIETDVVYGVKEPLIVDFVEKPAGVAPNGEKVDTPFCVINYDFVLQKRAKA